MKLKAKRRAPNSKRKRVIVAGYTSEAETAEQLNVAIRTLLFRGNSGEMGVGGGIVWDSTPQEEYEECQLKSAFLCSERLGYAPRPQGG